LTLDWNETLDDIDWAELSSLYLTAGLGVKKPADLETSFTSSRYRCFVYENGKLIGAGRALADGVDCSYICDVSVLPSHQGKHIGKEIVSRLVERSRQHRKIILYAAPGKEDFYRRFGFRPMATAMAIFEDPMTAAELGLLTEPNKSH
jgi:ribosomal protein S18 acetylase RimI-like enzyme